MLSAAIVASAAACGTSTPSVSVSNQENSANTPSTASAVSQSAVESSNTTLSEVSLNDLGEGYTLKNIRYSNINKNKNTFDVFTEIYYNDDFMFNVNIDNIPKEYYKNEQKLCSIPFTWLDQDNWEESTGMYENSKLIKVGDIKIGDTNNDVLKKLGVAHEIVYNENNGGKLGSYTYYKNGNIDGDYISYAFDENDCVNYISIMHK